MTLMQLCNQICLQEEIKTRVLAFAAGFDFSTVGEMLKDFRVYEKMAQAQSDLQNILGEDADHIKNLACMLKASADIHSFYYERNIGDKIYFETMKCYPRFIAEAYQKTGKLCFDRYWWTTRQAGGHLFRIGALEYEKKPVEGRTVISIHIPSDADFSPPSVRASIKSAKSFFAKVYPELKNVEYRCHSWLLDRQLEKMLAESSHILQFQNLFEILNAGEISTDFVEWIFQTKSTNHASLPENTTLQRAIKRHLLSGGVIRTPTGRLKCAF